MTTVVIELELPAQQYEQLAATARARELSVAELAQVAVMEWLEHQARLKRARALMRQLGQGLGEGRPPHDVARNHDAYLYARNP